MADETYRVIYGLGVYEDFDEPGVRPHGRTPAVAVVPTC